VKPTPRMMERVSRIPSIGDNNGLNQYLTFGHSEPSDESSEDMRMIFLPLLSIESQLFSLD